MKCKSLKLNYCSELCYMRVFRYIHYSVILQWQCYSCTCTVHVTVCNWQTPHPFTLKMMRWYLKHLTVADMIGDSVFKLHTAVQGFKFISFFLLSTREIHTAS